MRELTLMIIMSSTFLSVCLSNRAKEEMAARNMQAICIAERKFARSNDGRYASLSDLVEAKLLPDKTWDKEIYGYVFTVNASDSGFTATAVPSNFGAEASLAYHTFYSDEKNAVLWKPIKYNNRGDVDKAVATSNDRPYLENGKPIPCE